MDSPGRRRLTTGSTASQDAMEPNFANKNGQGKYDNGIHRLPGFQ